MAFQLRYEILGKRYVNKIKKISISCIIIYVYMYHGVYIPSNTHFGRKFDKNYNLGNKCPEIFRFKI